MGREEFGDDYESGRPDEFWPFAWLPPNDTASMQRDINESRPSELESQNGAVVRLGQEVGVETPLNAFIYRSLLPLELKARGELQFSI